MKPEFREKSRRLIDNDSLVDDTPAACQPVRVPYQPDTVLFGGWGIKL
jgi:hypothetical protein